MKASIRLASLMRIPWLFVFTHDSIGLGEDGPTHPPVEQLASLRAQPNLHFVRPADANETALAYRFALAQQNTPTAIVLTRQPVTDTKPDVEIPGESYGFTRLKHAQAIGDLDTLRGHGLPAERVTLTGDDPATDLRALSERLRRLL